MKYYARLKRVRVILTAVLLGVATNAHAASWYPVAVSTSVMIFVDRASIKKTGNTAKFWQWQLFARPIGKTDSAKTLVVMDCKSKQRKSEYMVAISEIDTVQQEGKVDSSFEVVLPNTLEYGVYDAVCNNKFSGQPQKTVNINDVRSFLYRSQ